MERLKLSDRVKKFICTLDEEDLAKITFTEDAIEYEDESIHDKLMSYHKATLAEMGAEIREFNKQLRAEHPEYFE